MGLRASQGAKEGSLFLFLRLALFPGEHLTALLLLFFQLLSCCNPELFSPKYLRVCWRRGSCCRLCRERVPAASSDSLELLPVIPDQSVSCSVAVCSLEGQCLLHSQHQFGSPQGPIQPVQLQLEPLWADATQVQAPLHSGHMLV